MNKMGSSKTKILMRDMMNGLNTNKTGFYITSNFQIKNMKFGSSKMLILIFNKKKNSLRRIMNNKNNQLKRKLSLSSKTIQLSIFRIYNSMSFIISRYKVFNQMLGARNRFKMRKSIKQIRTSRLNPFKILRIFLQILKPKLLK